MNPIKRFFFSCFGIQVGVSSPDPVPFSEPPKIEPPQPSCFAKGVAELWKRGEGWKVKRSKLKSRQGNNSTDPAGYIPALWNYCFWDVELVHARLGIRVILVEFESDIMISISKIFVNGEEKMGNAYYYNGRSVDLNLVRTTILSHPYPALKRRLVQKVKQDATREAKMKEVEALGCPAKPEQQPGIMKCPA